MSGELRRIEFDSSDEVELAALRRVGPYRLFEAETGVLVLAPDPGTVETGRSVRPAIESIVSYMSECGPGRRLVVLFDHYVAQDRDARRQHAALRQRLGLDVVAVATTQLSEALLLFFRSVGADGRRVGIEPSISAALHHALPAGPRAL